MLNQRTAIAISQSELAVALEKIRRLEQRIRVLENVIQLARDALYAGKPPVVDLLRRRDTIDAFSTAYRDAFPGKG